MTSSPYLRTPLILRWKTSPSPNVPSSWNSPFNHSSLLEWSYDSRVLSWHPLWFPSLHWMILPLLLSFLLTHSFLHVYDPETISFGRGHYGSQEGNTLCQGRSKRSRSLLDHLLGGLNRSWVHNPSWLRSSDRPQPSRCFIMAWPSREFDVTLVGTAFQIHSLVWYWWLGREMRGRGEHREGLSGMSSEGWRIWNIKIDWAASLLIASSFTLLMILWTFLEQLILIWHLTHYDSHSLEAVSHSSLSQVINQVIFPFIS